MSPQNLRRAGHGLAVIAVLLLLLALFGMVRERRTDWDRGLVIPALVLILLSRSLLRYARHTLTRKDG